YLRDNLYLLTSSPVSTNRRLSARLQRPLRPASTAPSKFVYIADSDSDATSEKSATAVTTEEATREDSPHPDVEGRFTSPVPHPEVKNRFTSPVPQPSPPAVPATLAAPVTAPSPLFICSDSDSHVAQ